MAEGLHIGYVDVHEHVSLLPLNQQRLRTFPLHVLLEPGSTPLDDAWQAANANPLLVWLATNAYDLFGSATPDLLIGASVTRITGGQQIELAILPTGLVDAEIELRINTSAFTDPANYTATPTPKRGESFVIAGVRSIAGGACAPVSFKVGVGEGTAAADPRDVTGIAIEPRSTAPATCSSASAASGPPSPPTTTAPRTSTGGPVGPTEPGCCSSPP